jgi:FKBP-type peptidyl-prolyl cis-trans isomerase FklB
MNKVCFYLHTFLKLNYMMKRMALYTTAIVALGACTQTKQVVAPPVAVVEVPVIVDTVVAPLLKNAVDSFSYAVGMNIAASMQGQGISEINADLIKKAMNEVFNDEPTLFTEEEANMTLQEKLQQFAQEKSAAQRKAGEDFLAENKTKPGVTTLPNGLQYEIITPGDPKGKKPTAVDTVVVHYIGTLIDGTKFDASVDRGEPATFPVGGVIAGWTQVLQLMTKGAKWKVAIPSELAYGDRGAGGAIPPGAALVFEINLLDIKPAVKAK